MDFLPHTESDVGAMLARIGLDGLDDLFEPIPDGVKLRGGLEIPSALSEVELLQNVGELAERNAAALLPCFAGGGAYDHHVPAAVRALASRGEFSTSYTPYQPELSQGVLQAIFEFQTMVCELFGMEVANASLYDGAAALAEAVNLAVRVRKHERVLVGGTVHPHLVDVLKTYTSGLGIEVEVVPFTTDGVVAWNEVDAAGAAAVIVGYPNFFGRLEDVRLASARAHESGALSICVADPTAMGILESPGAQGADVVVGEGQALGNPLFYGGPYVGLFATRLEFIRQVPGRIVGETVDADGRRAYVLTLQAREQHIRRARATSNVCTNQTLMAIAATIHLAWLGPQGLHRLGEICARSTAGTASRLAEIPRCSVRFTGPMFKEFVLQTPVEGEELCRSIARRGFVIGPALGRWHPELQDCVLIAVTERRTNAEITGLVEAIEKELAER